ncbi:MAG: FAD:protein FMN transferase [Gammaproteobacteria bacterium]|nr:FAD:protein FMN transferase [Gammaproteobacteria bacterium]MBU1624627.1 FAD:protein FMN transferase [Gammaproteobacteria bacterium]MBU1982471.1 FAD:protein FMN transferase [Gammaproteobacteria bacterium]
MRSLIVLLALLPMLAGCGKEPLYQEQAYVFGTIVEVSIYGEEETKARQGAAAVMAEFQRLHDLLHAWQPSALSSINEALAQGKTQATPSELVSLLQDAEHFSVQSGGTFNPAIGGLIKAWGFQSDTFQPVLPDENKISALLKSAPQMTDLFYQPPVSGGNEEQIGSKNPSVMIDLGGFAKGYALDRAVDILQKQGISNALINIGGNVIASGTHGKRPWHIGIQHPRKPGTIATLELRNGEAVGTSGDYQRFFELDGKRYCHLLDPRSGQPVQGVQAVTVLTRGERAGLLSDVTSKPIFIAGVSGWRAAVRGMGQTDVLLIDADGKVHLTESMQKRLEFTDKQTVTSVVP